MPDQPVETTESRVNFTVKTFIAILFGAVTLASSGTTAYWVSVENDRQFTGFKKEVGKWQENIESDIQTLKDGDVSRFQEVKDAASKMEDDLKDYIRAEYTELNGRIDRKTDRNAKDIEQLFSKH